MSRFKIEDIAPITQWERAVYRVVGWDWKPGATYVVKVEKVDDEPSNKPLDTPETKPLPNP